MAKKLKNTVSIYGEDYEVTAKTAETAENAEQADKLVNSLTIERVNLEGNSEDSVEFDGNESTTISIVGSEGGQFLGPIRVPSNTEEIIDERAVLNYSDIKNTVLEDALSELKNNSVLSNWDGETLTATGDDSSIKGIGIITGEAAEADTFAAHNYIKNNEDATKFSAFIYVANDTGNIYFGTAESDKTLAVQVSAENAKNAENAINAQKIVNSSNAKEYLDFTTLDSIRDIIFSKIKFSTTPGTDDNPRAEKLQRILNDSNTVRNGEKITFTFAENATYAATAGSATSATSATQTAGKNIQFNYYQIANNQASDKPKYITISTSDPSGGNNGDIWIKHS